MLNNLYAIRRELYGPEYGAHKKAVVKGASTMKDIDLDRFDLDKPRELQMALLVVCGGFLGFRGLSEHTNLVFGNSEKDEFPLGHPYAGQEFWGIKGMRRKTDKLTTTNPCMTENAFARVPVKSKAGKVISKMISHWSPGQSRVYCKIATPAQRAHFTAIGHKDALFNPNSPIGINTLMKLMASECAHAGFPDSTGHGLCRLFITTLANDSSVSVEESMKSSGHNSVSAQRTYIMRDGNSETAKFAALGSQPSDANLRSLETSNF